jgi:hypothetical protein
MKAVYALADAQVMPGGEDDILDPAVGPSLPSKH